MSSMEEIQKRWQEKYGVLPVDERTDLIKKEIEEALERIKGLGAVPNMTADELMKLTRDY